MVLTFLVALGVTVAVLPLVISGLRRAGMLDEPTDRSLHEQPVLRGGGVATLLGTSVGLALSREIDEVMALGLILVPIGYALVGFADDHRSRSVPFRLVAQFGLSLIGASLLLDTFETATVAWLLAAAVTAMWIVAFVNVFNFMDGINGISGVTGAVVGVTHMVAGAQVDSGLVSVGGAALAAASIGFLPFNMPRARVFLGDVGSYHLGSYIALLSVIAIRHDVSTLTVIAPLAVYVVDASLTLTKRAVRGEQFWQAHREHTYQRLATGRLDHMSTALVVGAFTAAAAAIGLLVNEGGGFATTMGFLAVGALTVLYVALPAALAYEAPVERAAR
ncbi:MAG: MraY family glycosyltransferase [Acidimicrobiales bacterium]